MVVKAKNWNIFYSAWLHWNSWESYNFKAGFKLHNLFGCTIFSLCKEWESGDHDKELECKEQECNRSRSA